MTETKERPILFNQDMVRAILDGRKTQTRRPMNPQPTYRKTKQLKWHLDVDGGHRQWRYNRMELHCKCCDQTFIKLCPFGVPGDRLWIRETVYVDDIRLEGVPPRQWADFGDIDNDSIYYRADGTCCEQIPECQCAEVGKPKWTPSIHMPQWLSRITLEVVNVWAERVKEISERDAIAEGVDLNGPIGSIPAYQESPGVYQFANLFQSIYGNWSKNPWVWCCEFKVL